MQGMLDIHAHILPAVDDGSRNLEESLELIRQIRELGFAGVMATPHYYPASRPDKVERIRKAAEEVKAAIQAKWPDFQFYLGQELYHHAELTARLREGKGLTLAGTHYVLVEFEPGTSYRSIYTGLRSLTDAGYRPIVAHYERYLALREPGRLDELSALHCMLQMNYESLQGGFFDREVRWCRKQVLDGYVDLLGTDMHRTDYRAPDISAALNWLEKHVPQKELELMTRKNVQKILRD